MKFFNRLLLILACIALLGVSWLTAITAKTDADKQRELINRADAYLEDEVYVLAVEPLEEAASYDAAYTLEAETTLKDVYQHLLETSGYSAKYKTLLEKQMARTDATADIFREAADFYLRSSTLHTALEALRNGVKRTGDEELERYYESLRYAYRISSSTYEEASESCNGACIVKQNGKWGLASAKSGSRILPCEYDQVSTLFGGRVIVKKDDIISTVDLNNNRLALCHTDAERFANYNQGLLWLKQEGGWILANSNFQTGSSFMEDVGMFSNSGSAAKSRGKWGVVDLSGSEWIIPAVYDEIVQDGLGRCYSQKAAFVRSGEQIKLFTDGQETGEVYEDAHPFVDGWAAVKRSGLWGFVDASGMMRIDFQYEDARSFGGHLAAIKKDGKWGYLSLHGDVVIEPIFLDAKDFADGSAPVRTEEGWQFIVLAEYEE